MKNAEDLIYDLYDYYAVDNNILLAKKLNTTQQTISNWKSRNSVNAIKKKCKELKIYKQIFESENSSTIQKTEINRALYTVFKRRSLAYLYYLLKQHDIKNSTDFFNFNAEVDEESKFISFIKHFFADLTANAISFSTYRKEFLEYVDLYLAVDEIDFIFGNKEVFISSVYTIMEHQLAAGRA